MSEPMLGEIRLVAMDFAPVGWMLCHGQELEISTYAGLFELIGTTFGGDKEGTVFRLPDLRGRVPIGASSAYVSGREHVRVGDRLGVETVTLTSHHLPPHSHAFLASDDPATSPAPAPDLTFARPVTPNTPLAYVPDDVAQVERRLHEEAVSDSGAVQHDNSMPSMPLHYIIAISGAKPERTE